jgi:integral membrane protein (TIGR01906 family)
MKIVNVLAVLLVLTVPFILYSTNINLVLFNEHFYEQKFEEYGVYEKYGKEKVDAVNLELLDYFRNDECYCSIDFFTFEEQQHLYDVKKVVLGNSSLAFTAFVLALLFIILALFVYYKLFIKKLPVILISGGVFTVFVSVLLILLSRSNFNLVFTYFHKLLFEEGTWLFPAGSNLIGIYPFQFFYDVFREVFFNTMIHAFALASIGFFVLVLFTEKRIMDKVTKFSSRLAKVKKKTIKRTSRK